MRPDGEGTFSWWQRVAFYAVLLAASFLFGMGGHLLLRAVGWVDE